MSVARKDGISLMSMRLVFTQILVILLYVGIGFAAGKARLIDPAQRRYLSGLCSNLILPFTILSAASQSADRQQMISLGYALFLMLGLFGLSSFGALCFHHLRRSPQPLRAISTALITYPNCTFLGLPLCRALFGEVAVLYNAMAIVAFNVLFFTLQFSLFTGKTFNLRHLLTLPMGATVVLVAMLLLGWHFPDPVQTVLSATGAMITPLSLIIVGVMMSENRLLAILREKRAYVITLLRNILIPLAALSVLAFLPLGSAEKLCVLVYIACPCATLPVIFAIQNNTEPELAARSVLLSTLFFAASLPLIIFLGQLVF